MDDQYQKVKNIFRFFNVSLIVIVLILVAVAAYYLLNTPGNFEAQGETDTQVVAGEDLEGAAPDEFVYYDGSTVTYYPQLVENFVPNPGMGWIYKWGDQEIPDYETTLAYSDRSEISWQVLNPEEGVYDWTALDQQLDLAVKQGRQFSFRVYTMIGEGYGGHQLPSWVVDKGAIILSTGEPDYSSCVYQEEWGDFVQALIGRYDGNPNIAFIDISGYGNFNEWNWSDAQTIWDNAWEENYGDGIINYATITSIDGQARRRLADIFIGGNNNSHRCRNADKTISTVSYSYPGFQTTQLVMPYAGIVQSTQYVFSRDHSVGFRHDCFGRSSSNDIVDRFSNELDVIWRNAPIVYETCRPSEFSIGSAYYLLENIHASVIHNVNIENLDAGDVYGLSDNIGYKYFLAEVEHSTEVNPGGDMYLKMVWENLGRAPSYPRMGQDFQLVFYLENATTGETLNIELSEDISKWMPAEDYGGTPPRYVIETLIELPQNLRSGDYITKVAIIDKRTGMPINLAITGEDERGYYYLSQFSVVEK